MTHFHSWVILYTPMMLRELFIVIILLMRRSLRFFLCVDDEWWWRITVLHDFYLQKTCLTNGWKNLDFRDFFNYQSRKTVHTIVILWIIDFRDRNCLVQSMPVGCTEASFVVLTFVWVGWCFDQNNITRVQRMLHDCFCPVLWHNHQSIETKALTEGNCGMLYMAFNKQGF